VDGKSKYNPSTGEASCSAGMVKLGAAPDDLEPYAGYEALPRSLGSKPKGLAGDVPTPRSLASSMRTKGPRHGVSLASHGRKLVLLVKLRELSTRMYLVEPQFKKCGAATSPLTLCPKTAESTGQPPTPVRLRRLLDPYRGNVLRDKNLMKTKRTCEYSLSTEEPVKFEEAKKEDGWRRAMDKPTAGKSVLWMLQGTTKMTLARSSWRTWDPGRS
jgi:hypothetical protein